MQPVISSVVKGVGRGGVRRAGKGYMDKKILVLLHLLSSIEITNYFNPKPRFSGIFSRWSVYNKS